MTFFDDLIARERQSQMAQRGQELPFSSEVMRASLKEAYTLLNQPRNFEPGDLVRMKKGLNCGQDGLVGGIGVCLELVDPDKVGSKCSNPSSGDVHAPNCYDCVIGEVCSDGAVRRWYRDSRFFEKAE